MRRQQALFDVRVFDPNTNRYLNKALPQCYIQNEKEKKRQYNERVLETDHGSFTPLVFSIYGGMGRECSTFYNRLAKKIVDKRELHQSIVTKLDTNKNIFRVIKVGATRFTWTREY